uniref:Kinesin motor domain-containing protein n=2 Tax=Parascaris univalens TaxID=6257 RepID=A0A915BZN3_PARUN
MFDVHSIFVIWSTWKFTDLTPAFVLRPTSIFIRRSSRPAARNMRETPTTHPGQNLNRRRSQSVARCLRSQQVKETPKKLPEVPRSLPRNRLPQKSGADHPHRSDSIGRSPLSAALYYSRSPSKQVEMELAYVRKQLHDKMEEFQKEKEVWGEKYHAEMQDKINAIAEAESIEQQIHRLEQMLHDARMACCKKEVELRMARERIVNIKGRIRLCVRIRPLLSGESRSVPPYINICGSNTVEIQHRACSVACKCHHLWTEDHKQADVFGDINDFIQSALHGYNVAVIAYGQTGAGKTYTMRGADEDCAGIIPRSFDVLFRSIGDLSSLGWQVQMTLSVFEIYLGRCFDLLAEEGRRQFALHFLNGAADFRELKAVPIVCAEEAMKWIYHSDMQRSWAVTKSSKISSRGHTIVRIKISSNVLRSQREYASCLSFADLAGSERVSESGVTGERLEETKFINKSLSQLGMVLRAQLNNSRHVPYMSDPLTKALAESLGAGSSRTMFIAHIRPNSEAAFESRRTIEFSNQAMRTTIGEAVLNAQGKALCSQQSVRG